MDKIFKEIQDKIKSCENIAVISHINEDPDTLGSCFAMKQALDNMNKKAVIYISAPIEKRIQFIGSDYVLYTPQMREKHDLCICLDCGDVKRIGNRKSILDDSECVINIDHHGTNTRFGDINYVDAKASSVGEILYDVFKETNIPIDDEIARDLYIAVSSDTGSFKYSNVSPKTMHTAASLLEYDFDNAEISRLLFDCRTLKNAKIEADALMDMECFFDGRIKLVSLRSDMYEKYDISEQDAPNLVDIPRSIEGTEIALCLKETRDGIKVNMRSNANADVSKAALELGGGGHIKAAGATIKNMTLEEAKEKVVSLCEKVL